MADISRETYGIEKRVDYHGIQWLNEKHIEEGLDYKNLQVTTVKYLADHKNIDMNQQMNQKTTT